jgi:Mrp family chromosome partitioning ATPase
MRSVAVVARVQSGDSSHARKSRNGQLRQAGMQVQENLWLLPAPDSDEERATVSLHSYLGEVRKQFEYSIVEASPAGDSNDAVSMAQFADGLILVLSAERTRRVAARKIREELSASQVRLLGAVLSDREFPIPEGLYRRL